MIMTLNNSARSWYHRKMQKKMKWQVDVRPGQTFRSWTSRLKEDLCWRLRHRMHIESSPAHTCRWERRQDWMSIEANLVIRLINYTMAWLMKPSKCDKFHILPVQIHSWGSYWKKSLRISLPLRKRFEVPAWFSAFGTKLLARTVKNLSRSMQIQRRNLSNSHSYFDQIRNLGYFENLNR